MSAFDISKKKIDHCSTLKNIGTHIVQTPSKGFDVMIELDLI